jgi:histidinol-phosphate aminotransferase
MLSWVRALVRPDIAALEPYQHAAWEPSLERLHANELPWRAVGDRSAAGLNRYPEPQPRALIDGLAALYGVPPACVLAARGSDEAIDLLTRAFCRADRDAVLLCPPTFGMYSVCARIQGAKVIEVPLLAARGFALDERAVLERYAPEVKLVFLCSPNNPTGNLLEEQALRSLCGALAGRALVIVDEAYIEFAGRPSLVRWIGEFPNLAVLRTLSKAYGLAGARCGALIADGEIIAPIKKIIPPYAISQLTLEAVLERLAPGELFVHSGHLEGLLDERRRLTDALAASPWVARVWPSDANFILIESDDADAALSRARAAGLLVRDARAHPGLGRALRVTVGSPEQNARLLEAWA